MQLENKIALITGGATGIGGATARLFGERGATVLIVDYNKEEGQAVAAAIQEAGGQASFFGTDVRSEESVAATFTQINAAHQRLDTLICSAGVLRGAHKGTVGLSEEDWDDTIDTNIKGTFLTAKYAAPLLQRAGQSVVLLISSGAGVHGGSSSLAYAASKAGMHGMQYNLERDISGARLHVICPGGIATPLKLENIADGARIAGEDPEEAVAKARLTLGDPMGIARVLAFLASAEGDYLRGTVFTR
jgi:NAD(P)-dependent dehydrogenase (short-subunit alcohol dehydrogenase family)